MEKPVRIVSNDKIRSFSDKIRGGIEHALNFMLAGENVKIQIGTIETFLMPIETYLAVYKKKSVLIKIHAEKEFSGEIYWFFEIKTAIALGGLMRMLPLVSMREKIRKEEFDSLDLDSFGEVGNQLSGILDRSFRGLTYKDVHLRMDFEKKVYDDPSIKLENFQNKEEFVVLLSTVTLPELGQQKITILLPRSFYEVLLNIEIELEGIMPKILLVHSWSAERMENLQRTMNSRNTKVIPLPVVDDLFAQLDKYNVTAFAIDLKKLEFPMPLPQTIFLKRIMTNRSSARLPYFLCWETATEVGLKEVKKKLGLNGKKASLETEFPPWALALPTKVHVEE